MCLGGKGPDAGRGAVGVAVRAPLAPPRAWNILPRPPERSSCSRRKFPPWPQRIGRMEVGSERAQESGSSRTGSETLPPRCAVGQVRRLLPKTPSAGPPGCNTESASQALLQSPEASGRFRDHQARRKIVKYILCALWCVSACSAQAGLVPRLPAGPPCQPKPALSGAERKTGCEQAKAASLNKSETLNVLRELPELPGFGRLGQGGQERRGSVKQPDGEIDKYRCAKPSSCVCAGDPAFILPQPRSNFVFLVVFVFVCCSRLLSGQTGEPRSRSEPPPLGPH